MKNVDEECPLSGEKTIKKDVDLPKEIPPVRDTPQQQTEGCLNIGLHVTRESTQFWQTSIPRMMSRLYV